MAVKIDAVEFRERTRELTLVVGGLRGLSEAISTTAAEDNDNRPSSDMLHAAHYGLDSLAAVLEREIERIEGWLKKLAAELVETDKSEAKPS